MNTDNSWVTSALNDFLQAITQNYQYVVVGSVALISYTGKIGYERKIHDVDIICQAEGFSQIANKLICLGYQQSTFIDKKMPFYKTLMKLAGSKYYRFQKEDVALELMTTPFKYSQGNVCIELYPGFRVSLPESSITTTNLYGINFRAATPEALHCIYSIGFTTWGRVVKAKNSQVIEDLKNLKGVTNEVALKNLANQINIEVGKVKFKLPHILTS